MGAIAKEVWDEALAQVTPHKWQKYVDHCERLIKEAYQQDCGGMDNPSKVPRIVIEVGGEESSESDVDGDLEEWEDDQEEGREIHPAKVCAFEGAHIV